MEYETMLQDSSCEISKDKDNKMKEIEGENSSRKRPISEELKPILIKIGNGVNENVKDIHINKDEIKIVRARDNDEMILSTFISRTHCRLTCIGNNDWIVTNLSSTSTLLNDEMIPRGQSRKIVVGDTLQLSDSTDFKYLFTLSAVSENNTAKKTCLEQSAINEEVERQKTQFAESQANEKKDFENKLAIEKQKQTELQEQLEVLLKQQRDNEKDDEKLKENILALEKKIELGDVAEKELKLKHEQLINKLEEEKRKFEEQMAEEKRKLEEELESTRKEKENLVAIWKAKEAEWHSKMDNAAKEEQSAREKIANEKLELEEKMKKLQEEVKEKEARIEQVASKNAGPKNAENCTVLLKNNVDFEILDTIDLTGDVIEEVVTTSQPSANKDSDALNLVNNIMEEQLTCSVCSELFVCAMTLNCTHTFCQHCILSWMKKSKNCPNCRAKIVTMNKSLVLDNFIEKMVENISLEQKQRRIDLIKERARPVQMIQIKLPKNIQPNRRR